MPMEMEESMEKAEAVFDAESESGTALSASTVAMLEEIRGTTVEDAEAIANVAAGQKVDPEAMASRAQRRAGLAKQLLETLGTGLRRCFVFMRYALQHLRDLHISQERDSKKAASVVELLTAQLAALRKLPEAEKMPSIAPPAAVAVVVAEEEGEAAHGGASTLCLC